MQIKASVDVSAIIKRGIDLYKSTISKFIIYALIAVMVSEIITIYVGVFDTFFVKYRFFYIGGLIFLVLLYLPIIYYSVRIAITSVGKLKAVIEKRTYDYSYKFEESKDHFWRVFLVLIIRFVLKLIFILSIVTPIIMVGKKVLGLMELDVAFFVIIFSSIISAGISLYLMLRLEFATLVIYWHVDTEYSDLKTSMLMTKYLFAEKLKIILFANIPGILLGMITTITFFVDFSGSLFLKWVFIFTSIVINILFYSWSYSIYYPLFEDMKAFALPTEKNIDEHGREWQTF